MYQTLYRSIAFAGLLAAVPLASAQPCPSVLSTQTEVNQYPPSCTVTSGNFSVKSRPSSDPITDLSPLSTLTRVSGVFLLDTNYHLQSLVGLDALQEVDGAFYIARNSQLTSLDGLEALREVGGKLLIFDNDALIDVLAIGSVQSVNNGLSIYQEPYGMFVNDNPMLSDCECGLGPLLSSSVTNGQLGISDNAPGCSSIQEVRASSTPQGCAIGLDPAPDDRTPFGLLSASSAEALAVSPNPVAAVAELRFTSDRSAHARLSVFDLLGREVAVLVDREVDGAVEAVLDADRLPAGIYVARLVAGGQVETVSFSVAR